VSKLPSWQLKTRVLLGSGVLLAVALCFFVVGAAFCAATLHVRRRTGAKPDGAAMAQIIAPDNTKLKAWWFQAGDSNRGCVMVLHGISDSKASSSGFAPLFLKHGYSVLAPDSRAHGESGGEFVTYGLLEKYDVIAWAHWMKGLGCQRVYGLGESLGASVLIQAISVEPVFNAVVAESPFADLQHMGEYRVQQMIPLPPVLSGPIASMVVESGLLYARLFYKLDFRLVSPAGSLRNSSTPVFLIHGVDDRRTPPAESRSLAAARPLKTTLWLVPGGGHTNASAIAPARFRQMVLGFFGEN